MMFTPGANLTREEMNPNVGGYFDGLGDVLKSEGMEGVRVHASHGLREGEQGLVLGGEILRAKYDDLVAALLLFNEKFPGTMTRPNFVGAGPDHYRLLPTLL